MRTLNTVMAARLKANQTMIEHTPHGIQLLNIDQCVYYTHFLLVFWQWFAVVCRLFTVFRPKFWCDFVVVCGGLRWFVVVCDGLRWFVLLSKTTCRHNHVNNLSYRFATFVWGNASHSRIYFNTQVSCF